MCAQKTLSNGSFHKQEHHHGHDHEHSDSRDDSLIHEQRTRWVVYLTAATMVVEIMSGYWTNSMALLADGWHMASHVFALGLSWIAYIVARKYAQTDKFSFNKEKLLSLSGFTSAVVLLIVAISMAIESFDRFLHPLAIKFNEAIYVAIIGLAVNGLSAFFLRHKHQHHDYNIRSAYLHVLADGLTSLAAIMALFAGKYFNLYSFDSISGIISSVVITKWAIDLMKGAGTKLIEFKKKSVCC